MSEGIGEAGRRGEDVRSDLWVRVERRGTGGIQIDLRSKVEAYYGESLHGQVADVLAAMGLAHARVEIVDAGALPFVVAARLEAACRAAGATPKGDVGPTRQAPARPRSPRDRLRRSRLYLPGNEPKYMVNAGLYLPDAVILDLEDSVHSGAKPAARMLVRNALRVVDFGEAERMVRINQLPLGLDDLDCLAGEEPDLVLVPKVESPDAVVEVEAAIDRACGADGGPWLMPILESALGIERAFDIARAGRRVVALTLGLEDYAADLGVPKSADGAESAWARQRAVNAARAAGLQAIDSVYGQVDDLDGLRAWADGSRRLGFVGMGCVHPRQIGPIHEAYAPPPEQLERALRIVEAYEQARAAGLGVVSLGSKMIDPPVVRQALRLVDDARAAGRVSTATDER